MILYPGVALITGAASGIGQTTATSFASEGCTRITICDRDENGLQTTKSRIEAQSGSACKVLVCAGDISQESFVQSVLAKTVSEFGRVDYGVNCAGEHEAISNRKVYGQGRFF
ncbi:hypothetical protein MBLNU230_g5612t2 [Neophaeotheca triangularis]